MNGSFSWLELGYSPREAAEMALVQRNPDSLSLGGELALWQQWVIEIERGELLTRDEIEAASSVRDDIDATCKLVGDSRRRLLVSFLDDLDMRYRKATICSGSTSPEEDSHTRWWQGRIPFSNRQRQYLEES